MNDRYRKLTKDLAPDDYRGWAAAIKKGGYATDGNYVKTIVGVIEGANLQKYDQMVMQEMKSQGKSFGIANNPLEISTSLKDSIRKRTEPDMDSEGRKYSFPLKRSEFMLVTSPFGIRRDPMDHSKQQMHKGIDIQTRHEAVLATEDNGRVIKASQNINTGGGRTVTIEYNRNDGSKYQCTYMHLDSIAVKVGDTVNAGQKLGISGNTGTRTTGEHLHFGVKVVSTDGASRDLDPAAYLADIAQKGNIQLQALHNGNDIISQYKVEDISNRKKEDKGIDSNLSPDEWMKKILSSEDSGASIHCGDPVIEMAITMFTSLMALAVTIEGKNDEEKMQASTDAAISKSISLTSLLPSLRECDLVLQGGKTCLKVNNGNVRFSHELSNAELAKLQQTLGNTAMCDDEKRRSIGSLVNGIVASQQASQNYRQGIDAQRNQESIQMK
jgi:murein DD-endopeptidase MepM/ murein hydrolase activator NlpD